MMLLFHHCARRDVIIAVWGCKQEGCHPSESFSSFSVPSFACRNGDNVFVSILKEKKNLAATECIVFEKKKKKRKGKDVESDAAAVVLSTLPFFPEAGSVISFLDSQTPRRNDQTEQN